VAPGSLTQEPWLTLTGRPEVVVERPITHLHARLVTDHVCGPEVDA
jgi:hypothetical protein